MAIELLTPAEQDKMRSAGRAAAETLSVVKKALRAGMSTADIDALVQKDTAIRGGTPSQLGYQGFPAAVCTSRNEVVCHGIPSAHEHLLDGDIINVDVTTNLDGYHGDTSSTFIIGDASAEAIHVVRVAEVCRDLGVSMVRPGVRLGDIGEAIETLARRKGCTVVKEFGGHGIGRKMHLPPHVPHHGEAGRGLRLKAGMAITIEPMVNLGKAAVRVLEDGWRTVTADGRWSAQFEHTVLVTRDGHEVLTHLC